MSCYSRRSLSGTTTPAMPSSPGGSPGRSCRQLLFSGASTPVHFASSLAASGANTPRQFPDYHGSTIPVAAALKVQQATGAAAAQPRRQQQVIRAHYVQAAAPGTAWTAPSSSEHTPSATPLATVRASPPSSSSSTATTCRRPPAYVRTTPATQVLQSPCPSRSASVDLGAPRAEQRSLRQALRQYKAELESQLASAEEVMHEISPQCWTASTPSAASRQVRSLSPETPYVRWTSIAAQSVPKCSSAVGTPPTAAWALPPQAVGHVQVGHSPVGVHQSASKQAARAALETALEELELGIASAHLVVAVGPSAVSRQGQSEENSPSRSAPSRTAHSRTGSPLRASRQHSYEPAPRTTQTISSSLQDARNPASVQNQSHSRPEPRRHVMSCNNSRVASRATSRVVSRATSRAPTPEPPARDTVPQQRCPRDREGRLRAALRTARAAGLDSSDSVLLRAETFLLVEEQKKTGTREELRLMQMEFQDARNLADLARLRAVAAHVRTLLQRAETAGLPEVELRDMEKWRRKVHNAIEDLKGNLRVFCRVRPLNPREIQFGDYEAVSVMDAMRVEVPRYGFFTFDSVFSPGSQQDIFEDCRDLIQSAVDGHNVTIFAYGQTGAGKTYTLYGSPQAEGISHLAIHEIFSIAAHMRRKYDIYITASMIELHRNRITDLLRPHGGHARRTGLSSPPSSPKLGAREASGDKPLEREARCAEELQRILTRGLSSRVVAPNAMNAESSRSHVLFTIKVHSVDLATRESVVGKIVLCDLGGSERLKKTEAAGDQLKEAIEINRSLTALGDVIEAVAERRKQVPYRNHKLTQLLQDSLGGTAKTLMFVCCSPAESSLQETAMSLTYATRAKRIVNVIGLR
eukprot:TRINITY_DN12569_c0_g1_i1.p1 TRINITY_DN12569_c0_g1~~TRINITY_DN12569_c0_g1_i1.p1  ORF type:complete len:866 (+),score=112.47 TRINITY_DN12569_c0_g1_i1:89-2686(+)